jgi:hypothetical protein
LGSAGVVESAKDIFIGQMEVTGGIPWGESKAVKRNICSSRRNEQKVAREGRVDGLLRTRSIVTHHLGQPQSGAHKGADEKMTKKSLFFSG